MIPLINDQQSKFTIIKDKELIIILQFDKLKKEAFDLINTKKIMVLATSLENRVTARSMSCVVIGDKIYFQTDKAFLKYQQLEKNPKVALAIDNIQLEGSAVVKGHPLVSENKAFADLFNELHKSSFNSYSHMENEVVIQVTPALITLWKYEDGKPFRDFVDLVNQKATREFYDNTK